jgi:hypothetical protein
MMLEALLLLQGACTHGIASAPAFGVVYSPPTTAALDQRCCVR